MKDIKAVIFDLYGTLISIHTDEEDMERLWKPLSYFYGYYGAVYTPEELKEAYGKLVAQETASIQQKRTDPWVEIQLENVFKKLFTQKKVRTSQQLIRTVGQMYRACSSRRVELYPGAMELLGELKRDGKEVYLLSNAQRVFTEYEMKALGIYDKFDGIWISSDWGCKKPSHEYFNHLLQELPYEPEEIMMVGNSAHDDMEPALQLGLRTCFLNTDGVENIPNCDLVCDFADYQSLLAYLSPDKGQ